MTRDTCNCCFSFLANFCPFAPIAAQKIKISKKKKKMKKRPADIIILNMYQKLQLDDVRFLRHGARCTDGQMDTWKK